jgi:hypothetical protein
MNDITERSLERMIERLRALEHKLHELETREQPNASWIRYSVARWRSWMGYDEDFQVTAMPAGWTHVGSTLNYSFSESLMLATFGTGTNQDALLYRSGQPPGTHLFVLCQMHNPHIAGQAVGFRVDDGTSDNYTFAMLEMTNTNPGTARIREWYRIGGGTPVNNLVGENIGLPHMISVGLIIEGTKWSNWLCRPWATIPFSPAIWRYHPSSAAFSWTPQRFGIYFRQGNTSSTFGQFRIDAVKYL